MEDTKLDFVQKLNNVQPRVWAALQFVALLCVLGYGGNLLKSGAMEAGTALISGSLALLKFEIGGSSPNQS